MCQWPYFKEMDLLNLLVLSNENLGLKSKLRQIRHFKECLSLFKHTNVFLMQLVCARIASLSRPRIIYSDINLVIF